MKHFSTAILLSVTAFTATAAFPPARVLNEQQAAAIKRVVLPAPMPTPTLAPYPEPTPSASGSP